MVVEVEGESEVEGRERLVVICLCDADIIGASHCMLNSSKQSRVAYVLLCLARDATYQAAAATAAATALPTSADLVRRATNAPCSSITGHCTLCLAAG